MIKFWEFLGGMFVVLKFSFFAKNVRSFLNELPIQNDVQDRARYLS